ncbi:MAG: tRNA uridine-5-carboxymethylaminomethyl(34) synthesis GTPase MnmE [Betaproteobacteria bacterium]|nr:tRNA uridine-5-carboxymethylaminomethyl(34) synthesis GTPase MnmE [Pseudomonadota bacterium]NBO11889.1 tRNA uridine-5-carboxymethylaminomethyl(34) synthesis GTPase MnmE [Betaproteobacteria bacterium]NBO43849.1 tRNA uridine-5-carboxymethylaminomethyl(34) synthesis GTPase MnmE [Betaproteobacteria bacterium]NBP09584.1 tRNA uridine-5-carboxymethylaminomethyl(34) synthesis GTPase MnmE [Betaproteobacteria bacterium]NBP61001.1 tRNA uridine-5-carboxymethylaminomethyl(34) synthesis GTPase MnmE [Betap
MRPHAAQSRPVPILAQASAQGLSAIAMLRLSGSDLALWLLPQLGWTLQARRASLRTLKAPDGSAIDQLVALFFPAPHSFTGEDVLELQTHGSPAVIAWAIEALLHYGRDEALRLARPGEFSERAFLNGRLDLAQAEAVADLIAASTRLQARAALRSLQGEFSIQVNQHLEAVQQLRVLVEAALDFPEEPVESLSSWGLDEALAQTIKAMQSQIPAWQMGAQLQQGLSIALIGPPNAGKSSLLNAFAGQELALVDDEPGTTRDRITQRFEWAGQQIEMTDTAGIRDAAQAHRLELRGMQRSWEVASRAQATLLVIGVDSLPHREGACAETLIEQARHFAQSWWAEHAGQDMQQSVEPPRLVVLNKLDLIEDSDQALSTGPGTSLAARGRENTCDEPMTTKPWTVMAVSAKVGLGLDGLMDRLLQGLQRQGETTEPVWARLRHVDALERALAHLQSAQMHWVCSHAQADLMAEELRLAQQALGEIVGIWRDEDLLGAIFGRFCIGK